LRNALMKKWRMGIAYNNPIGELFRNRSPYEKPLSPFARGLRVPHPLAIPLGEIPLGEVFTNRQGGSERSEDAMVKGIAVG
jgi:hypothetical protein